LSQPSADRYLHGRIRGDGNQRESSPSPFSFPVCSLFGALQVAVEGCRARRVVCPRDVRRRQLDLSLPRREVRPSVEVRIQGPHSALEGREIRRRRLAGAFMEAGARSFMPCAIHHVGFSLGRSSLMPYNAANMGPKRDLFAEMREATLKAALCWDELVSQGLRRSHRGECGLR
jgi:hypothetical protein